MFRVSDIRVWVKKKKKYQKNLYQMVSKLMISVVKRRVCARYQRGRMRFGTTLIGIRRCCPQLGSNCVWDTETISPKTKLLAPTSSTSLWQCGVVIQSRYNTYLLITDTKMRDYFHTDISRNDCKRVTYCQKVWLLKNFCVALSLCVRDWHELIS